MLDDATLLRRYVEENSNEAFAELVRRHLGLVYSAALRQVGGDAHLAEDVSQQVFTDLARHASRVVGHRVLAGWLYTSTHYAASHAVRSEQRRRAREQLAQSAHELMNEPAHDAEWARVRPALDEAMRDLKAADRDAILLRFFENRGFAEIGTRLRLTENAARMRVERALEKLHGALTSRGIRSTGAALAAVLTQQAIASAPATLAASVASTALASTASAGAIGGTLSFLHFMGLTKLQAGAAGALLLAGGASVVVQQQTHDALRHELASAQQEVSGFKTIQTEHERLARAATEIAALRRSAAELPRLRTELAARQAANATPKAVAPARRSPSSAPSQDSDGIFEARELDVQPRPRSQSRPEYPFEMRRAGIRGETIVSFVVDAEGNVQDAVAERSLIPQFEAPAVEAVKTWKFSPGQRNGQNVGARVKIPIVFEYESDDPSWF